MGAPTVAKDTYLQAIRAPYTVAAVHQSTAKIFEIYYHERA